MYFFSSFNAFSLAFLLGSFIFFTGIFVIAIDVEVNDCLNNIPVLVHCKYTDQVFVL